MLFRYLAIIVVFALVAPSPVNLVQGLVSAASPPVQPTGTNDNTTVPVLPPPPLSPEADMLAPPGTVTYANSTTPPQVVSPPVNPVQITGTGGLASPIVVTADYGTFTVRNVTSYLVTLRYLGKVVEVSGFFVMTSDGTFLLPVQPTLERTATGFVSTYTARRALVVYGVMTVVYNFTATSNKITAVFTPTRGVDTDYQIVWLSFSDLAYVGTSSLSEPTTPFTEIGQVGFYAKPGARSLSTSGGALKEIGNGESEVDIFPDAAESYWVRMNYQDVFQEYNGTFANANGSFQFLGVTGNVVAVAFQPGSLSIDPQTVATRSQVMFRYTSQRKVFFDGSVYWVFYYDGTNIAYMYSALRSNQGSQGWQFVGYVPQEPAPGTQQAHLEYGFTVVHYGDTVNVIWADDCGYNGQCYPAGSPSTIVMAEGIISGSTGNPRIEWRSSVADLVLVVRDRAYYNMVSGRYITAPVEAIYDATGQLIIAYTAYTSTSDILPFLARRDCGDVYCTPSLSPLSELAISLPLLNDNLHVSNTRGAIPFAFAGQGAAVGFVTYFQDTTGVWYLAFVEDWFDQSSNICIRNLLNDDNGIGFRTNLPADFDINTQLAVVPSRGDMELYISETSSTGSASLLGAFSLHAGTSLYGPILGSIPSCAGEEDAAVESAFASTLAYEAYNVTASVETDGTSNDVMFTQYVSTQSANLIYAAHVVPGESAVPYTYQNAALTWAVHYPYPIDLSLSAVSGHYVLGAFETGPVSGYYTSYLFEFPAPTDFNVGPNDPWVQLPGGPDVSGVNPASGVLSGGLAIASVHARGGSLSLGIVYREPGLYMYGGPKTYADPWSLGFHQYGRITQGSVYLALPWFDVNGGLLHISGFYTYNVIWNRPLSASTSGMAWFNNTAGVRFNFERSTVYSSTYYFLFTATGLAAVFNADGSLYRTYLGTSGKDIIDYTYTGGYLTKVSADSQPGTASITIGYDGTTAGQIDTISESNGRVTTFCRSGQSGCSTTHTLQVIDPVGRSTSMDIDSQGRLTAMTTSAGGKTVYSYAVQQYQWGGSDGYGIYTWPVTNIVSYNETGPDKIAQQIKFDYTLQDAVVVQANVTVYDRSSIPQGVTEYRFRSDAGVTSVRTLDASGQIFYSDMQTKSGSNLVDLSGQGNNLTPSGTINAVGGRWSSSQSFGSAAGFYYVSPTASLETPKYGLTISAWVYMTSFPGGADQQVVCFAYPGGANNEGGYALNINGNTTSAGTVRGSVMGQTTSTNAWGVSNGISLNMWYFLVASYDGRYLQMYVNGQASGNPAPFTASIVYNGIPNTKFYVGARYSGSSTLYGSVDEVRVYSRALSSDEILSLYNDNVIQIGAEQDWWAYNAQPHMADTYSGYALPGLNAPSSTSSSYVDDWGNTIYTRNAYGNESFASYANTNHQNEFYAPERLQKTSSGVLFASSFDYGTEGLVVQKQVGLASFSSDFATAGQYAPALRFTGGASSADQRVGALFSSYVPAGTGSVVTTFDFMVPTTSSNFMFNITAHDGTPETGVGVSGGYFDLYTWTRTQGWIWLTCSGVQINTWYTATLYFNVAMSWANVYLNNVGVCSANMVAGGNYDIYGFTLEGLGSAAWDIDDLHITSSTVLTINGLSLGQVAEFVSPTGQQLGLSEAGASGSAALDTNAIPRYDDATLGTLRVFIFAPDGTLDYQSPRADFFAGDVYTYVPSRTLDGRLVQTTTGFDRYTSTSNVYLNEPSSLSGLTGYRRDNGGDDFLWDSTGNGWNPTWSIPVSGALGNSHYLGGNGFLNAEWVRGVSGPSIPTWSSGYLVTYMWPSVSLNGAFASSQFPVGIGVGASDSATQNNPMYVATWGANIVPDCTTTPAEHACPNSGTPIPAVGNKFMGAMSPWAASQGAGVQKFVVKVSDLFQGTNPTGNFQGFYFQTVAGGSSFDAMYLSTVDGSLTVNGLPGGYTYSLKYANNGSWVQGAYGSALYPTANLYPVITAFPVSVVIQVNDSVGNMQYLSAPKTLWGGDVFIYTGGYSPSTGSGWYDAANVWPASTIHDALLGSYASAGDCVGAVLCYDMETVGSAAQSVATDGTGSVPVQLVDLSGTGHTGTLTGTTPVMGTSGLGLSFNGGTDVITASTAGLPSGSSTRTVSLWVKTSTTPPAARTLVEYGTGTQDEWFGVQVNSQGKVHLATWNNDFDATNLPVITDNQWHHVVAELTGGNGATVYVDGLPQSGTLSAGLTPNTVLDGTLTVQPGIAAYVDSVILYSGVLTSSQVAGLYRSRLPNAAATYAHPNAMGLPDKMHTILNGAFSERTVNYDTAGIGGSSYGLPISTTFNGYTSYTSYSGLYNSAFATQMGRPDGYNTFSSYNLTNGNLLSTTDVNCRQTRYTYDALGRPLQTVLYDNETSTTWKLSLDMQTTVVTSMAQAWAFKDMSCDFLGAGDLLQSGLDASTAVPGPTPLAGIAQWFDGSAKITAPDVAITNPITLSAWVKPDGDQSGSGDIISRDTGNSQGYKIQVTSNNHVSASFMTTTDTVVSSGAWNHPSANSGTTNNCGTPADNGDWTNPNSAYSNSTSNYATAAPGTNSNKCNEWSGFGFSVPSGATITYVAVQLHYKISKTGSPAYPLNVGLYSTSGPTKPTVQVDTSQPGSDTLKTFDFTTSASWTPAMFNSNAIKVDVGAARTTTNGGAPTFSMASLILIVRWTTIVTTPSTMTCTSTGTLTTGTWTHIAATFIDSAPNTAMSLYINGKQDGCTGTFQGKASTAGSTSVTIGNNLASTEGFKGAIDEVNVFNADRTSSVVALMNGQYNEIATTSTTYDDSAFPSTTSYSADSIPRGLFFDMNTMKTGQANTLEDLSGNGLSGIEHGVGNTTSGKVGNAKTFDGSSQYVLLSKPLSYVAGSKLTVTAWINPSTTTGEHAILAENALTSPAGGFMFEQNGAQLSFWSNVWNNPVTSSFASGLTSGTYHFVAVTYDDTTGSVVFYVDGATSSAFLTPAYTMSAVTVTAVGVYPYGTWNRYFSGSIDELQVIPTVLTSAQVSALYSGYAAGSTSFDTTHMTRSYVDGVGRGVRQVTMDLYGHVLTTAQTLGWNGQPSVSYMTSGQYSTANYSFVGLAEQTTGPQGLVRGTARVSYSTRTSWALDGDGRISYTTADLLGRSVQLGVYNPAASNYNYTQTRYNALDQTVATTLYQGSTALQSWYYYYNAAGLLVCEVLPADSGGHAQNYSYTYDNNLWLSTVTGPDDYAPSGMGRKTTYTYVTSGAGTGLGWPQTVTYYANVNNPTGFSTSYTYDDMGGVLTITNSTATVTRGYDNLYRMTSESNAIGSLTLSTGYTYDAASRVTSITYPKSTGTAAGLGTVGYTYDTLGRVSTAFWNGTSNVLAQAGYDSYGRLSTLTYPLTNSEQTTYTYDAMDRVSQIKQCDQSGAACNVKLGTYTYDAAGLLIGVSDDMGTGAGAKTSTFGYDANGRLVSATGPFSANGLSGGGNSDNKMDYTNYSYDAVGNILARQDSDLGSLNGCSAPYKWCLGQTVGYTYLGTGVPYDELQNTGINGVYEYFTYDGFGGMTLRSNWAYAYDYQEQLVKAVSTSPAYTYAYSYDGLGRRVKEVDTMGSTYTSYFAYTGSNLGYQYNATSGRASAYVYLGSSLLFRMDSGASSFAAAFHYYLEDPSGNVRVIWTGTGTYPNGTFTAEAKFRYKPFGQMATPLLVPGLRNPAMKFSTMPVSSTTGLYQMGVRNYDPVLGRFLSRDPPGPGDYSYAANNPISLCDPSGMAWEREGPYSPFSPWYVSSAMNYVPQSGYASAYAGLYGVPEADWAAPAFVPTPGPVENAAYEVSYNLGTWEGEGLIAPTTATTASEYSVSAEYSVGIGVEPTQGQPREERGTAVMESMAKLLTKAGFETSEVTNGVVPSLVVQVPESSVLAVIEGTGIANQPESLRTGNAVGKLIRGVLGNFFPSEFALQGAGPNGGYGRMDFLAPSADLDIELKPFHQGINPYDEFGPQLLRYSIAYTALNQAPLMQAFILYEIIP